MKNNLHKRSSRDNMDRKLFSLVVTFSLRQLRKYLRYKVRILDLSKNFPGKCSGNLNHTEHTLQPKGRSGAPHPGCGPTPYRIRVPARAEAQEGPWGFVLLCCQPAMPAPSPAPAPLFPAAQPACGQACAKPLAMQGRVPPATVRPW